LPNDARQLKGDFTLLDEFVNIFCAAGGRRNGKKRHFLSASFFTPDKFLCKI